MKQKKIPKPMKKAHRKPREPLIDRIEKVQTPEWVIKIYPNAPVELPKEFVKQLNIGLKMGKRMGNKNPGEYAIFVFAMNNFTVKKSNFEMVVKGLKKMQVPKKVYNTPGGRASNLLKSQGYEEFHKTVVRVINECGLSLETAETMYAEKRSLSKANRYLFPAFLKLLEMGYKSYPDLSA